MTDQVQIPATVDLSKYIETRLMEKRPHIRGRRVPVALLAYSARSEHWNAVELAYQFSITEAEALAALLYYEEHQSELDALEAAEQSELEKMQQLHDRR
ncbi:MAG: DUF433 domain-containing protein [Chloroflexi bacterium]|nr:DUF433 domain-containing protein [Chloroflexota bacterium]MCC6896253.1 DUF433 domain-containing protein [Anaerolineae bacterium]